MSIVLYTGGTFDIPHYGHYEFLKKCKKIADKVVVSLNRDEFVEKYKGKRPIMSLHEREKTLMHCKYVDGVIVNTGDEDSKPSILELMPDLIAVGSDWACKDYYKQMNFTERWLDYHGITLLYIPYGESGISTTEIKRRVLENDK